MASVCDGHLQFTPQPQRGTVGRCHAEDTELRGRRCTGAPVARPSALNGEDRRPRLCRRM